MTADDRKRRAADESLKFVQEDIVLGVGTGSTVNHFIEALAAQRPSLRAIVSSSDASTTLLEQAGFTVSDLNSVGAVDLYVDGADEATRHLQLIKGGGGALTREKIIAGAAQRFVCIADDSKLVGVLGKFPLPLEVIPMARSFVARKMIGAGGRPVFREGFVTDNGNHILDVHDLDLIDPSRTERDFNQIPGVVTVGLFALRGADELLIGTADGIERHTRRR